MNAVVPLRDQPPLLAARRLRVRFRTRGLKAAFNKRVVQAVEDVDLDLFRGESVGLVGESGCGKSTLARALVGLQSVDAGSIRMNGQELVGADAATWRSIRRDIQMVFQDPRASLNPRHKIGTIVGEPLRTLEPELSATERDYRVAELLERVGLTGEDAGRRPHQFSGGQCQRIAIARALIVRPKILICDEPVSALDVSIQAQIVTLLEELQREYSLTMLFIAHDLALLRHFCHRVVVMYMGRIMEQGPADRIFADPRHPYARALLAAVPGLDPSDPPRPLEGEPPDPAHPPIGCVFHPRCPMAESLCVRTVPQLHRIEPNRYSACHFTGELLPERLR